MFYFLLHYIPTLSICPEIFFRSDFFFLRWLCNIPVGLILLLAVSGFGLLTTILPLQIKFQLYYSYYHMKNPTINDKMKEYVLITSLISA